VYIFITICVNHNISLSFSEEKESTGFPEH